jgi:hypothetical protein
MLYQKANKKQITRALIKIVTMNLLIVVLLIISFFLNDGAIISISFNYSLGKRRSHQAKGAAHLNKKSHYF